MSTEFSAPTKADIARKLRHLADEMDAISVEMDYYGGFARWAQHGREIAGAGRIAREWADEIDAETQVAEPEAQLQAARIAAMEHVHDAILQDYTASDDAPVAEIIT